MGLQELIDQHNTDDADELALLIFEEVMQDQELIEQIVMPALRAAVSHHLRMAALNNEKAGLMSGKPTADPNADRLAFLADKFYAPPYGLVTWGEATVEMHQARIDYLNKKVNGLVDTITRHDKAIQEIKDAGAKNLGEIHGKRRRTRKKEA